MRTYIGPEYKIAKIGSNIVFSLNTTNGSIHGPSFQSTAVSAQQEARGNPLCHAVLFDSHYAVTAARVKITNEAIDMSMIGASTTRSRLIYSFFESDHSITTRTKREAMGIMRNRIKTMVFADYGKFLTLYGYFERLIDLSLQLTKPMIFSTDSYSAAKAAETCIIALESAKLFHIYAHANAQHHVYSYNSMLANELNEGLLSEFNSLLLAEWIMDGVDHLTGLSKSFGIVLEGIEKLRKDVGETFIAYKSDFKSGIDKSTKDGNPTSLTVAQIPPGFLVATVFNIDDSVEAEPELIVPVRQAKKSISEYILK
jgi:hypothetical protein